MGHKPLWSTKNVDKLYWLFLVLVGIFGLYNIGQAIYEKGVENGRSNFDDSLEGCLQMPGYVYAHEKFKPFQIGRSGEYIEIDTPDYSWVYLCPTLYDDNYSSILYAGDMTQGTPQYWLEQLTYKEVLLIK